MISRISLNPARTKHMVDAFTCHRCGRTVRAELLRGEETPQILGIEEAEVVSCVCLVIAIQA